jgi:hypothetical protein
MKNSWKFINDQWTKADLQEFKDKWASYKSGWYHLNEALFDLFQKYPKHRKLGEIAAKVIILGRTYSTGIERHVKNSSKNSAINVIVDYLYENGSFVDRLLGRLIKIKEPLTEKNLGVIIEVHGEVVSLLSKKLRNNNSARSFVSKYMHFHCRAVPIYDQIAKSSIGRRDMYPLSMSRMKFLKQKFMKPLKADDEYYKYCLRFFAMCKDLEKYGVGEANVRSIDHYLLSDAFD